jgi:hypothetical protein
MEVKEMKKPTPHLKPDTNYLGRRSLEYLRAIPEDELNETD